MKTSNARLKHKLKKLDQSLLKSNNDSSVHVNHVVLFLSHVAGIRIAEYFKDVMPTDVISALYLTGDNEEIDSLIIEKTNISKNRIFYGKSILNQSKHLEWLKKQKIDTMICVYWPWLLSEEVFTLASRTINFHPALLPINRGWYPHVYSIIDGSKTGVTLHKITKEADTGDVWVQKEVSLFPIDTAKEIYERLQDEIVRLFMDNWSLIKSNKIIPFPQNNKYSSYHKKNELNRLDKINIDKLYSARELINLFRSRSFGDNGYSYYEENGERIFINIRLSKSNNFK